MKISVIGCGYVGLIIGTCLANSGNEVICWDNDIEKMRKLKKGITPFFEPGLSKMVESAVQSQRILFTTSIRNSIKSSDVLFIAMDITTDENGIPNLNLLSIIAAGIGKYINGYKVVVNISTVPVGTAEEVRQIIKNEIKKRNMNTDFDIVSNPIFLREGNAIGDFTNPDRVVIGFDSERAGNIVKTIYQEIVKPGKIVSTTIKSAEMIKYAANAMLATRISFINDISNLCEILGPSIEEVKQGMGVDEGVRDSFYSPGIGYGGMSFARDVKAIINEGKKHAYNMVILKSVEEVNARQKEEFIKKISRYFSQLNQCITEKTFAVWGLSCRPGTNDMTEAPSIVIINKLIEKGGRVICYDPEAMKEAYKIFKDKISYGSDKYSVLEDADALLILTGWEEFLKADLNIVYRSIRNKVIFDGRNIFSIDDIKNLGFDYISFGNGCIYNHSLFTGETAATGSRRCSYECGD